MNSVKFCLICKADNSQPVLIEEETGNWESNRFSFILTPVRILRGKPLPAFFFSLTSSCHSRRAPPPVSLACFCSAQDPSTSDPNLASSPFFHISINILILCSISSLKQNKIKLSLDFTPHLQSMAPLPVFFNLTQTHTSLKELSQTCCGLILTQHPLLSC